MEGLPRGTSLSPLPESGPVCVIPKRCFNASPAVTGLGTTYVGQNSAPSRGRPGFVSREGGGGGGGVAWASSGRPCGSNSPAVSRLWLLVSSWTSELRRSVSQRTGRGHVPFHCGPGPLGSFCSRSGSCGLAAAPTGLSEDPHGSGSAAPARGLLQLQGLFRGEGKGLVTPGRVGKSPYLSACRFLKPWSG